jgi:uncharacterized OB-fold protein
MKGQDMQTLPPPLTEPPGRVVGAGTFVADGARTALRLSRCRGCGSTWFPARTQCSTCASTDVIDALSGSTGTAYASTVVQIGPAQFAPPYVLAYVDVDGARVLAHVRTDRALKPGTPVELRLDRIGIDEDGPFSSYIVVPTGEGDAR